MSQAIRDGERGPRAFVVVTELLAIDAWHSTGGDFAVIAPLARHANAYVAITKAEVTAPENLRGKPVATLLGSTSAWFLHEYLRAHGLSERDVALRHEEPGRILDWAPDQHDSPAAFFVREPHASLALERHGDRVRRLATARGYVHGYLLLGTWRRTLREHPGLAERLLRALDRGRRHASEHRDEVITFARGMFGQGSGSVEVDYQSVERLIGLDGATLRDMRHLGRWMQEAGLLATPVEVPTLFDLGPLRAVFPERVPPATRDTPP